MSAIAPTAADAWSRAASIREHYRRLAEHAAERWSEATRAADRGAIAAAEHAYQAACRGAARAGRVMRAAA